MTMDMSGTTAIDEEKIAKPGDLTDLLQRYRQEAGLTTTQISEALCLPPSSIEMLEREDFANLPEPPYVRGYLRNYARLAEKDPADIVALYDAIRGGAADDVALHFSASSSMHDKKSASGVPRFLLLGCLLALLAGGTFWAMSDGGQRWWAGIANSWNGPEESYQGTEFSSLTGEIPGNLPGVIAVKEESGNTFNEQVAAVPSTAINPNNVGIATSSATLPTEGGVTTLGQALAAQADVTPVQVNDALPDTVQPTAAGDIVEENSNETAIRLVFSKDVWMRIRDANDKSVFEQMNKAGTEKELMLLKPLKFRIGNASGLELYIDGQSQDISPYIKGSIASFGLE